MVVIGVILMMLIKMVFGLRENNIIVLMVLQEKLLYQEMILKLHGLVLDVIQAGAIVQILNSVHKKFVKKQVLIGLQ